MKKKQIYIIALFIVIIFVCYKAYKHHAYIKVLNTESVLLADLMKIYCVDRYENFPVNGNDFNDMLEWIRNNGKVNKLLNYGINFKYDSINKSAIVYSFGVDKKDGDLEDSSLNHKDTFHRNVFYKVKDWSFFNSFNVRGKDIILFEIYLNKNILCSAQYQHDNEYLILNYDRLFVFYNNHIERIENEKRNFLKGKILEYQKKKYPSKINDNSIPYFLRYQNDEFNTICNKVFDTLDLKKHLKDVFIQNDVNYAVFPIFLESSQ